MKTRLEKLKLLFGIPAITLYILSIFTLASNAAIFTEWIKLRAMAAAWVYFVAFGFMAALSFFFCIFADGAKDGEE